MLVFFYFFAKQLTTFLLSISRCLQQIVFPKISSFVTDWNGMNQVQFTVMAYTKKKKHQLAVIGYVWTPCSGWTDRLSTEYRYT